MMTFQAEDLRIVGNANTFCLYICFQNDHYKEDCDLMRDKKDGL